MSVFSNSSETGLADGTTVDTTNSDDNGAGSAFASAAHGGASVLAYSTDQAKRGTLSIEFGTIASQLTNLRWNFTAQDSNSFRWYIYIDSVTTGAATEFIHYRTSGAVSVFQLQVDATNHLKVVDSASAAVLTFTNTIPMNQWVRLEFAITRSTGAWYAAQFIGDDLTADETHSGTGASMGATDAARVYFGKASAGALVATFYGDDAGLVTGSAAPLGPSTYSGPVSLSGTGTLSTAGSPAPTGSVAYSGTGTLTTTGSPAPTGTVPFTGSGTLEVGGTPWVSSVAAFNGEGVVSGDGSPSLPGSLGLSGEATLDGSGSPAIPGSLVLSGDGALTLSGVPTFADLAALSGEAFLSLAGVPSFSGSVAFTGSGTLTLSGYVPVLDLIPYRVSIGGPDSRGSVAVRSRYAAAIPLDVEVH